MASLTIYASANGGDLESYSTTVAVAQAGTGGYDEWVNSAYARVGQLFTTPYYHVWQMLLEFSLSGLSGTINSAVLGLASASGDNSDTDFTARVRDYDYGAAMTIADFRAQSVLASTGSLRATFATSGGLAANDSYNTFTDVAMPALVTANIGGTIRLVVFSDRQQTPATPVDAEYVYLGGPGYTYPPRLVVDYTPGGGPATTGPAFIGGGFF